jgi:hypothetical protein
MVNTIEFSWGRNSAALHVWKHSCKSTTVSPALPCGKWSDKESDPHGTASDTEIDLHEWSAGSSSHKAANLQLFINLHYAVEKYCKVMWKVWNHVTIGFVHLIVQIDEEPQIYKDAQLSRQVTLKKRLSTRGEWITSSGNLYFIWIAT